MKCLIMMAVYNGEKYISQQIDSILAQTLQNWELLIRDDGSDDNTIAIIKKYEKLDDRIHILINRTDRTGAYLNFWTLIHEARKNYDRYDYYFFADQDDVWPENKLQEMTEAAKEFDGKPLLLYGDMSVIDGDNNIVYRSLNKAMGIGKMHGYSLYFTHGFLWGCNICVNGILFNQVPMLPLEYSHIDIVSHDNYFGKYALLKGYIKYIDKPLIKHRRHGDNTTGGYAMVLNPAQVMKKAIYGLDDITRTHARVYNQTLIFIEQMELAKEEGSISLSEIKKSIEIGGIKLVRLMRSMGVQRQQKSRTIGIYMIALTKMYRKYLFMVD